MDVNAAGRRPTSSSFSYLLFLAFMFFLMNGGQNDTTYQRTLAAAIDRRILQKTRFSDWLYGQHTTDVVLPHPVNTENEEEMNRLAEANRTFVLPTFRDSAIDKLVEPLMQASMGHPVYHRNITGFLKGEWKPLNVSLPLRPKPVPTGNETEEEKQMEEAMSWEKQRGLMPWYDSTQAPRKVSFNVREVREAQVDPQLAILRGNLEFQSKSASARLDVEGLHFLDTGRIYFLGRPEEYLIDIRGLPALLTEKDEVNRTARAVLHELDVRIQKMSESLKSGTIATGDADFTTDIASNCSFAIFGRLSPEKRLTSQELTEWEANMETPTGSSVPEPAPAVMNAIAYSENCGLVLEVQNAESLLMDRFWNKALNYCVVLTLVAFLQVYFLVGQMESTGTAATISRVSYWMVSLQVGMDAYIFVTHLTLGVVTDNRASIPLLLPSFALCLSSLLFGLRYAASIRVTTAPAIRPTVPAAPTPAQAAASAAASRAHPSPAGEIGTAPTIASSAASGAWGDDSPIWLAVPLGIIISIVVLIALFGWMTLIVVGLYSYWIPQIYANADRDTSRRTLQQRYIVGTTICRLFLPVYIWGCPDNVLFAQPSRWVYMLVAYQAIQVGILLLQDYLGPRFFLPDGILPVRERWDYHPVLPPIDLETSGSRSQDCVICLEAIELPNKEEADDKGHVGALWRWSYMVPPCHHLAHTQCLESWLAVKSECPVCRRPLPPL